jgi:hypothetical protein
MSGKLCIHSSTHKERGLCERAFYPAGRTCKFTPTLNTERASFQGDGGVARCLCRARKNKTR